MDGSGVIHVVKNPSQILPYCVIKLMNKALSSEYHKPSPNPAKDQERQQIQDNNWFGAEVQHET